ncbi:serine/threonine-protein kinase RsbW [Poseidonocella pacifica]|uniref:Serine/threonine-protein kinase RsbW n=1 Tax=Poseidonocella pacifica TaxID=871651 RepID=A0A1I0XL86_9RHOB|nr:ATP-binding protein [Poseidonocella pacifica]SFB01664.1 serine/threonine-protein kinase RsbW [Poseidonocella pacifica]
MRYDIPATSHEVHRALSSLTGDFADHGLGTETSGTLQLVLAEALNNIVEHSGCAPEDCITLTLDFQSHAVQCALRDAGMPPPDGLHSTDAEFAAVEELPEGGFGLQIIFGLVTDLTYRRCGAYNILSFSLPHQT